MSTEKFHSLPPGAYRLFGLTLGLIALTHLVFCWCYGDVRQGQGMVAVIILSTAQYFVAPQLTQKENERLLHIFNLASVAIVKLCMPEGVSGAPLYIAFALSTVTFSAKNKTAYLVMLVGAILIVTQEYQGSIGGQVPPRISMAISLTFFGLYTYLFVGDANRRKRKASKKLQETEVALLNRQNQIHQQRVEILTANKQLTHQATLLDAQLERATRTTRKLASRRMDESELVRAMHHDLREPLRSMISFNQLISRKIAKQTKDVELRTFLDFARDAGLRMDRMLADLLVFTTTSTSSYLSSVSIIEAATNAKKNLSALIDASSAQVTIDEIPEVLGVETQLIQLFQNLIANAIKYARPGISPIVHISGCKDADNSVRIEVSDNGVGIPEIEQERIFNLFSRVESSNNDQHGSGVGLALCKRITLAHGASLSVQSKVGRGSTFHLKFPPKTALNIDQDILARTEREHNGITNQLKS